MKQIAKALFRGLLPLIAAYILLFISPRQPRPYLVSVTFDWIVRFGLTVYLFFFLWAIGDVLTGEWRKALHSLEDLAYPPFHPIWAFLGLLGALAMIFGFCLLTYWIITLFLPHWIAWRNTALILVILIGGWAIINFYVGWIRWYKITFR